MIGLLLVVAILGGLAAIAIVATNSETSVPSVGTKGSPTTLASGSSGAASDIQAAAIVACRTNYQAVNEALQAYEAINGHAPTNIAALQGELKDPVTSPDYTFGIDAKGQITVATKSHPASPGDANCAYAG